MRIRMRMSDKRHLDTPNRCHWRCASPSKSLNKLFWGDVRLAKNASQRTDFDFAVHRHNTAFGFPFHDDMTAALSHFVKAEPLKRTPQLSPRNMR